MATDDELVERTMTDLRTADDAELVSVARDEALARAQRVIAEQPTDLTLEQVTAQRDLWIISASEWEWRLKRLEALSPQPPAETGDDDAEWLLRIIEPETEVGQAISEGGADRIRRITSRLAVSTGDDELVAEVENLRRILSVARPYISDKAGAGIIGAIDEALSRKGRE